MKVFLLSVLFFMGGLVHAKAEDNSKAAFEQRLDELTEGKIPIVICLEGWQNDVSDKVFHHGNIYSISPYALMTYMQHISEAMDAEYEPFYLNGNNQLTRVPSHEGFSQHQYDQESARLDSSATFLDEKKPPAIFLKSASEGVPIKFILQDDGGYLSTNAPYWHEFVMRWAYKFRGIQQDLPEPLASELHKKWSDVVSEHCLFGTNLKGASIFSQPKIARGFWEGFFAFLKEYSNYSTRKWTKYVQKTSLDGDLAKLGVMSFGRKTRGNLGLEGRK